MGLYLLILFLADMVQAVGAIMDIRWIYRGDVVSGRFCIAQGAIQQLGESGVAMTTLVIALHTFVSVWWGRGEHALRTAKIIMIVVWLYIIGFVAIGIGVNGRHDYEIPTPYWCWIGENFLVQRILGEYIWFWLTLLVSIVAYIPLCLYVRGNITVNTDVWWRFRVHRAHNRGVVRTRALDLIAYPLVYSVLVLPLSVVRWLRFIQERHGGMDHVPPAATFAVVAVYGLSGAANVLLFSLTRPNLLLFKKDESSTTFEGQPPSLPTTMTLALIESRHSNVEDESSGVGRLPGSSDVPST